LDLNWSFNFYSYNSKDATFAGEFWPSWANLCSAILCFVFFPSSLFWQTRLGPEDRIFAALLHQAVFARQ
jgi:hypothetical protein